MQRNQINKSTSKDFISPEVILNGPIIQLLEIQIKMMLEKQQSKNLYYSYIVYVVFDFYSFFNLTIDLIV